jgi:hypothetical protein
MKIKVYIVTYKNDGAVSRNLESLYRSDLVDHDYEINIINNHSEFNLAITHPRTKVIHNNCRVDWSTGYLARDWNFSIVDGFRDLCKPDCDLVVACQNDTVFFPDWMSYLVGYMKEYDFVSVGIGDNCMCWTPEGVRSIGLFDETYCSLGCQEIDYFQMAVLLNPDKSSINDNVGHSGHWNCLVDENRDKSKPTCRCSNKTFETPGWATDLTRASINIPEDMEDTNFKKKLEIIGKRFKPSSVNRLIDINYSMVPANLDLRTGKKHKWKGLEVTAETASSFHMNYKWHDLALADFEDIYEAGKCPLDKFDVIKQRDNIRYPYFEKFIWYWTLMKRNYADDIVGSYRYLQKSEGLAAKGKSLL